MKKGLIEQGEELLHSERYLIDFRAPHTHGWLPWGSREMPMTLFDAERQIAALKSMWGQGDYEFRIIPFPQKDAI